MEFSTTLLSLNTFCTCFQYPKDKVYHDNADIDSCLAELKRDDKLAVSVSRLRAENCALIRTNEMYCFPIRENLYTYSQSLRTTKKYDFLPQINVIIGRALEGGLFQKWHRDSSMYRNDPTKNIDRRTTLSIAHIGAALLALVCGLSIASSVFILEWIVFDKIKQKKCRRFWFIVSKFVDGRRFYFRDESLNRNIFFVKKKRPAFKSYKK